MSSETFTSHALTFIEQHQNRQCINLVRKACRHTLNQR